MLDGDECPDLFWFVNCAGAPFDPFDPTDDLMSTDIVFYANNTSGTVDLTSTTDGERSPTISTPGRPMPILRAFTQQKPLLCQ